MKPRELPGCAVSQRGVLIGLGDEQMLGDAKIHELRRVVFRDDDVLRLDVAVKDTQRVRMTQRLENALRDRDRVIDRQRSFA